MVIKILKILKRVIFLLVILSLPIQPLESSTHFPSVLQALKPLFQKLSVAGIESIFLATKHFEQFALMLFEPILLTSIGLTAFCAIIVPLHFNKGAFIRLISTLREQTWTPYAALRPYVGKILKFSNIVNQSPTMAALTITAFAGGVNLLTMTRRTHFFDIVNSVPVLQLAKHSLEIAGAESFRVGASLLKGAIKAIFEDNRDTFKAIAKWLDGKA